jgi:NAD(P)-dependent dehydrogenase (short-subunit alcohol dehydrogenase family)
VNGLSEAFDWSAEIKSDVLFNNAAAFDMGSVLDADLDQYDRLFSVNVKALYAVMLASAKSMIANGQSRSIVNLASLASHRGDALIAQFAKFEAKK